MPDSNFVSELNSSAPQPAQRYIPSSLTSTVLAGERALGPVIAEHVVLLGGEPLAPLLVGQLDLAGVGVCVHGDHVSGAGRVNAMKFGVAIFPTEDAQDPAELARMAEDRGFESLLFPEHTHIPASRETPYPAGGELPPEYSRTYDPFVALTAAAAATERLLIGTGICLIIERDPITTAKEVASIDQLSAGRFLFGVGAGWNVEEMRNHGTDASRRFGLMRERVEAMKAIWTQDEASYHGEQVQFERIWSWPKPLQQPHPPILVGGNGAQRDRPRARVRR